MGMFDDLIPAARTKPWTPLERQIVGKDAPEPGQKKGMFDDLIPPQPDFGAVNAAEESLGDALSFNLMDEATAGFGAGVIEPIANLVSPGSFPGDFGERYDRRLESIRARKAAAVKQHPTASGFGTGAAIAMAAPKAVAGLVAPAMRSATMGERVINAGVGAAKGAAGGAGYSALSGFGAGEDGLGNRLESAAEAVPAGVATGGIFGAGAGALSKMPVVAPSKVAAAADRSGVYVPEALASDNPAVQQAGGAAKSIPIFGTRIANAGKRTAEEFAAEKARIAEEYGGGAAASPQSAGQEARDALENWIGPLTKGVLKNQYDAVDALVNPAVTTPLNETARVATSIVQRNSAATLPPGSAVAMIRRAVSTPAGLTYQGLKDLRTRVGEMLDTPSLLPADMSQSELKRIYGALTKDLRAATENAGGLAARKAFDKANFLNAAVQKRREELMQVLGINKPASPEAVFAAIYRKAGSKSSADIAIVNKVRKSMPPDAWDQIASGVIGELGRSDALASSTRGEIVSLDKFFTHWNQISDAGKTALFGNKPSLRAALDDLATIAQRGKEVAKWANPSGTAQHGAYITAGAALANPALWPKIAVSALGAHLLTRALTRPATVRAMSAWARVWNANHLKRLGAGGPAQQNINALKFVSRRFAVEIGHQFGLAADRVNQLAIQLAGGDPNEATAAPNP